jgi:hypothetical protein
VNCSTWPLLYGTHQVVLLLDSQHANVLDRWRKPGEGFGDIHDGQDRSHGIDFIPVTKIDALLLPGKVMLSQVLSDVTIGVGV